MTLFPIESFPIGNFEASAGFFMYEEDEFCLISDDGRYVINKKGKVKKGNIPLDGGNEDIESSTVHGNQVLLLAEEGKLYSADIGSFSGRKIRLYAIGHIEGILISPGSGFEAMTLLKGNFPEEWAKGSRESLIVATQQEEGVLYVTPIPHSGQVVRPSWELEIPNIQGISDLCWDGSILWVLVDTKRRGMFESVLYAFKPTLFGVEMLREFRLSYAGFEAVAVEGNKLLLALDQTEKQKKQNGLVENVVFLFERPF